MKQIRKMNNQDSACAYWKNILCSKKKLRPFVHVLKGLNVGRATAILNNSRNPKFSGIILKLLNSAVSNAVNNKGLQKNDLVIMEAYATEGRTLKRIEYRARMGTNFRRKYMSHLFIRVGKKNETVVTKAIVEETKE